MLSRVLFILKLLVAHEAELDTTFDQIHRSFTRLDVPALRTLRDFPLRHLHDFLVELVLVFLIVHIKSDLLILAEQISRFAEPEMPIRICSILDLFHARPAEIHVAGVACHFVTALLFGDDGFAPGTLFGAVLEEEFLSHLITNFFLDFFELVILFAEFY